VFLICSDSNEGVAKRAFIHLVGSLIF
jgi:hypothetical protein